MPILDGLLETEQDIMVKHQDLLLEMPQEESLRKSFAIQLKERGDVAFQNKKVVEADVLYKKVSEYDPDYQDPDMFVNRSKLKFQIGEIEQSYQLAE